jgi:hypothetical protein
MVAVEKQLILHILSVCVCSLRYTACNARASYCHLWRVQPRNIFPFYLIYDTIFGGKKLLNTKCVFWFPLKFLSEAFLIPRRIQPDMIKNVYRSSCKVPAILVRFQSYLTFFQVFEKCSNIKFHENPSSRSRLVPCRRTDMTKLIVAHRKFSNAPNNEDLTRSCVCRWWTNWNMK